MSLTIESDPLFVGQQRLHFDALPSTNDHLKTIIAGGESVEGLTVTTEYQTSGRGQIGNSWHSEEGKNLLMSVYLRPQFLSASYFFYLNMSVCLAVADALNYILPGFVIKWPNDILFDRKKVAGILIESTIASGVVQSCIIGIGLNVNQRRFAPVNGFEPGSLRSILGKELDREYILKVVLKNIEVRYLRLREGFSLIRTDYFNGLYGFRQKVKAMVDGQPAKVEIIDVLADGQLVAEVNGVRRTFLFKEIRFVA